MIAGSGLGLLVSQLNNYTLSPIDEERVSEAAGVNSAGGSFGLSFGLAFAGAIMLAVAVVHVHAHGRDEHGAPAGASSSSRDVLEHDAELMSNTQLEELLADEPPAVQAEIIRINTDARPSRCRSRCWSRSSPRCSASHAFRMCGCPTRNRRRRRSRCSRADRRSPTGVIRLLSRCRRDVPAAPGAP